MDLNQGTDDEEIGTSQLDSHADTTAAGSNMRLIDRIEDIQNFVDVAPYSDEYEPIKDIPIGRAATAWTDPETGTVWIIVFQEVLYFGDKLTNSLICPNQIRSCNYNTVSDVPKQFDSKSEHAIALESDEAKVFIPLSMEGVISYFDSTYPTEEEMENCDHIIATSDHWDPHSDHFRKNEAALRISSLLVPTQFRKSKEQKEKEQMK